MSVGVGDCICSTDFNQRNTAGDISYSTSCARGETISPRPSPPVGAKAPRAPPSRRNVTVLSHAEYVPMLTAAAALRVKAALSKAACLVTLTF